MVTGPPCAVCGSTLRWLAAQTSWGCDRCQRMFPAAPGTAGLPPGHGAVAAAQAPRPKRGLVLGLVAAAVAIVGAIVAFVLLRGDAGAGGGSREVVVERALAAMAAGDAKALARLHEPVALYPQVAACDAGTGLSAEELAQRDPARELGTLETKYRDIVEATKGSKLELVRLVTKPPPALTAVGGNPYGGRRDAANASEPSWFSIEKGEPLSKGCVAKLPLRIHEVTALVKVTPLGQPANEQEVKVGLLEVDGRWYLGNPPEIATTGFAAIATRVEDARDAACACQDAACVERARAARRATAPDLERARAQLGRADRDKLEAIERELEKCEHAATANPLLASITAFKDRMCACDDDACAQQVVDDINAWSKAHAQEPAPPADVQAQLEAIDADLRRCTERARAAAADPLPAEEPAAVPAEAIRADAFPPIPGLPAACEEYRQTLIKLANCSTFAATERATLPDTWATLVQALGGSAKLPPEAVEAVANACREGVATLKLAAPGC